MKFHKIENLVLFQEFDSYFMKTNNNDRSSKTLEISPELPMVSLTYSTTEVIIMTCVHNQNFYTSAVTSTLFIAADI